MTQNNASRVLMLLKALCTCCTLIATTTKMHKISTTPPRITVRETLDTDWPKQTQLYLYGAEAGAATHKQRLERRLPAFPIIRAEVYSWRKLQGITEIKLHRRGTSNTGETFQAPERMVVLG